MRAVVKDGIAEVLDEHPKCRNPKCQLQRFSKEYQALVAGYKDLDGKGKEI